MSAAFSVSPDKRGLLELFQIVRCGCPGAGRSLPYGKVNSEPTHEARTLQRQSVRCCESGTPRRWGMKQSSPNRSVKGRPRQSPPLWRVVERMMLATAKVVTAAAKLLAALWLAGFIG
jgi:hypothetical protein